MVLEMSTNCTAPLGLNSSRFNRQPPMKIPMHAPGIAIEPAHIRIHDNIKISPKVDQIRLHSSSFSMKIQCENVKLEN